MTSEQLITEIKHLCGRHAHTGVVTAVHELAAKIVRLIMEWEKEQEEDQEA